MNDNSITLKEIVGEIVIASGCLFLLDHILRSFPLVMAFLVERLL